MVELLIVALIGGLILYALPPRPRFVVAIVFAVLFIIWVANHYANAQPNTPPNTCDVYEDGSARCSEGTFPWSCETQGNHICGD